MGYWDHWDMGYGIWYGPLRHKMRAPGGKGIEPK